LAALVIAALALALDPSSQQTPEPVGTSTSPPTPITTPTSLATPATTATPVDEAPPHKPDKRGNGKKKGDD
jgi:serine/threonine-protein kinase